MSDAADESAVETWEVSKFLPSLVDKSLVIYDEASGRYRMLETMRQLASDLLVESNELNSVRGRHVSYFVSLAEEAEPHLTGAEQQEWLERLDVEHDNLRAALEGAEERKPGDRSGLRICGAIWRYWGTRGFLTEGRLLCGRAIKGGKVEQKFEWAKAINGLGVLEELQGDYECARESFKQGLAIRRKLGDQRGIAGSLHNLGLVDHEQGDFESARSLYGESLAIQRELGGNWAIAMTLNNLGNIACALGDYPAGRGLLEESLVIRREMGDRLGIALSLMNLGGVAYYQGDETAARSLYEESLAIRRELGDRRGIAQSLMNLANIAIRQTDWDSARARQRESLPMLQELGDRSGIAASLEAAAAIAHADSAFVRAILLWGAAERLRQEMGAPIVPCDLPQHESRIASNRAAFGDDAAFANLWEEGREMEVEQAIELALSVGDPDEPLFLLSGRSK